MNKFTLNHERMFILSLSKLKISILSPTYNYKSKCVPNTFMKTTCMLRTPKDFSQHMAEGLIKQNCCYKNVNQKFFAFAALFIQNFQSSLHAYIRVHVHVQSNDCKAIHFRRFCGLMTKKFWIRRLQWFRKKVTEIHVIVVATYSEFSNDATPTVQ